MARIALIDDHTFFRKGVEAALTAAGHEVVLSLQDGNDALKAIAEAQPDIVLLDQAMRPVDGATILNQLRQSGSLQPVIMLTNELMDAELLSVLKAKVNGIVFKHCPEMRLFEAIDAVVAGRRYVDGDLVDRALAAAPDAGRPHTTSELSQREQAIADLVCQGLRNSQVAERLGMTEGTVKIYLHNIYRKLGVANRTLLALKLKADAD